MAADNNNPNWPLTQGIDYRAPINPHPVGHRRPFIYRRADRKKRIVAKDDPEQPRFVTEHIIRRTRWPRYRRYRPPPPPPPPPVQANGRAPRRSARVAGKPAGTSVDQAAHATAQARAALAAAAAAAQAAVFAEAQFAAAQAAAAGNPAEPLSTHVPDLDIDAVLRYRIDGFACDVCDQLPDQCAGEACYAEFLRTEARQAHRCVEIRQTGGHMGLGLYMKPGYSLPANYCLGEYLGELVPPGGPNSRIDDPTYTFAVADIAQIDARRYGNYTRFVNHHCRPNAEGDHVVIGHRHMIKFRSLRPLVAGEQIFISYGADYFANMMCLCNAQPQPHKPPR